MYTKIIGTGSYLPEQVRTNADLEKMVETSDEWIVTRTGIRERRIAAAHETVATMGFEAAKQALAMAGVSAEQIGLIIVATTSGTHAFPSSACQIQSMLIGMAAAECSHKEAAGAATGFVGLFAYLGASLSGWPLAQVMDIWHWTGFFVVIAIAAGISALLLLPFLNAQAPRTASEA